MGILRHRSMAKKTIPQLEALVAKYAEMSWLEVQLSKDKAEADDSEKDTCSADDCNSADCSMHSDKAKDSLARLAKAEHRQFTNTVNQLWQDQSRLKELRSQAFNETYSVSKVAERLARKHSR